MSGGHFQCTIYQRRHHHATQFDQGERRMLQLLALFVVFLIAVLGLSGCMLIPGQRGTDSILYLGWDDLGREQLFVLNPNERPRQLTSFDAGVREFAPSPDGRHLVLSIIADHGDTELWIMEDDASSQTKLHNCPQTECSNFAWAPDSRRLLFERREISSDGIAGPPALWWLDTQTAAVLPLQEDGNHQSAFGRPSPDGQWLSYHSANKEGLLLYNLENGASKFIANEIGMAAAWSPDGRQLVVPLLDLVILHGEEGEDHQTHEHDYQTAVHLLRLDIGTGKQHNISGDSRVEDNAPAWSPDGQWLAFGRRAPGTAAARQLWIMQPDGTEARALTDDPSTNHGPPIWSADGRHLLFQQIPQNDLDAVPGIWRIDVQTGEKEQLVPSGMQPAWLPPSK